jgi:hypothetical protein
MVKRTAPIRVVSLILLAACGAMCQKRPAADLLPGLQLDGSISPEVQRQEISTWRSLPDAPSSVQPPSQAERFHTLVNEARSPSTQGAVDAGAMRGTELGLQPRLIAPHKAAFTQEGSSNFAGKSTYPPLLKPDPRYYASMSSSFMGRASYAASRIFITRDDSGKGRLNTRYFLGVLSSVAMHAAYRPYWARSTSNTFNNFGSTIGSGAGSNLYHEFGPGFQQMVKGHLPKFLSRVEDRITHAQTPRDAGSSASP